MPPEISIALVSLQPPAGNGIRRVAAADMHVTLHFLGSAERRRVSLAMQTVTASGFTVRLTNPGHFSLRGGRSVLWVGIEPAPALTELHASVGRALVSADFEPESRPYVPHITVARLGAGVPQVLCETFEQRALPEGVASFPCNRFALFASQAAPKGVRYCELESYPLPGSH